MRTQVRTVDSTKLRGMSQELAEVCRPFSPDLVVGIATGGAEVAQHMVDALPAAELLIVKRQRAGTAVKTRWGLPHVLRALPRWLGDLLRRGEVFGREAAFRFTRAYKSRPPSSRTVALQDIDISKLSKARRVLIVDDTVDSGETMLDVLLVVEQFAPAATKRTAALATTWRRVPIDVDYVLAPRTLLRLPSSFDA